MPLASGLMLIDRFQTCETSVTFIMSPATGIASAGDTVYFDITVSSGCDVPDGYVNIIDLLTNEILETDILSGGITRIAPVLEGGTYSLQVNYFGILDGYEIFLASSSAIQSYVVKGGDSTLVITSPLDGYDNYFSYADIYPITARVSSSYLTPTGVVTFKVWHSESSVSSVAYGELDEDGYATAYIPAEYLAGDGYNRYIQAEYYGAGKYLNTATVAGTAGRIITPVSRDATSTGVSIDGTFLIDADNPVFIAVSSANLDPPSIGLIEVIATQEVSRSRTITLNLGRMELLNGNATINVPANTFERSEDISLTAYYIGDGKSYAYSTSSVLTFTPR
jgi:hypothetical protein